MATWRQPRTSDQIIDNDRRVHLLRLTAAGGRTLLITDLVSSDTVPQLAKALPAELPKLMLQCLQSGNFFSGLYPAVVQHDIQHIPACLAFVTLGCGRRPCQEQCLFATLTDPATKVAINLIDPVL